TEALRLAREKAAGLPCEVEVDDLDQLAETLHAGADEVLLDNFSPEDCERAVRLRAEWSPKTRLEASGGLKLEDGRRYTETGVCYLAVGALAHSAPPLDVGMDLRSTWGNGRRVPSIGPFWRPARAADPVRQHSAGLAGGFGVGG